jgi:hydrogenase maturation protease
MTTEARCIKNGTSCTGVALITLGNPLRCDDGIAAAVCNAVAKPILNCVCRFDLDCYQSLIGECLNGHTGALIVDATARGIPVGSITAIDLSTGMENANQLLTASCHGFSFVDELRFLNRDGKARNLRFLGIEIEDTSWGIRLSSGLSAQLSDLATKIGDELTGIIDGVAQCTKQQ